METQKRRPKAASGSLAYAGADTYAGRTRIQDRETQIVGDSGNCLSMHQPYASLLVRGIKRHEGRTWYSPHRGRLWIASAAKVSLREDIEAVEEFYRLFLQGKFAFMQKKSNNFFANDLFTLLNYDTIGILQQISK